MLDERKRSPFFVFRVESAYGRLDEDYSPKVQYLDARMETKKETLL